MITDETEYLTVRARAAAVFHLDARLPAQLFTAGDAQGSLVGDVSAFWDPDFWPAFQALACYHGDRTVDFLLVDGPACVHLRDRGEYPALSMPVGASVDEYWDAVGFDSRGFSDAYVFLAETVAVVGPSGRWGCWGERDHELAVYLGFPNAAARERWREEHKPFFAEDSVAEYFSNVYRNRPPQGIVEEPIANYFA
ncbi:hypothetical protein [Amycolatopsis sp. NPDC051903]|uniref:hypothetical protein n=1 Tax=Amycolatopsis sp. NPDC051903 TaxID=3363936 RepID=UPI0037AE746D